MAFLNEQGLQHLVDKINVRSSKTLPDNAPDGTIIIDPDEDTEIFNVDDINIDVDSALSLTSTNPVQNKVVTKELERIPCKLTVKCTSFDGEILTVENTYGFYYNILDGNKVEDGEYLIFTSYPTVKTVYKNCTYRLLLALSADYGTEFGQYYDPIVKGVELSDPVTSLIRPNASAIEKVFTVTQDTEITIMFQKKREPITLTINLKDKNGNFVSDDVIVTDSFDNNSRTFGTYGKTPGQFTVQVTKGYEYTITPSLKGYNKKEDNSPTDPDKTTITQTSTEDAVIDIVYNKIYSSDFETDWASFHAQIAANPGVEVLPIGTELSTTITTIEGSDPTQVKFHIVNWRYADKEDGSQVWGCDLLTTQIESFSSSFYESKGYSWEDSQIRSAFNEDRFIGSFKSNFANHIQKVKVTSGNYKNTPVYTYDNMWLPSATEMYINTASNIGNTRFTKVVEGNNNEKYWKNIMGASSKFDRENANRELIFSPTNFNGTSNMYESSPTKYWLRSCAFTVGRPNPDSTNENYIYDCGIFIVKEDGTVTQWIGTDYLADIAIRPMCFFA